MPRMARNKKLMPIKTMKNFLSEATPFSLDCLIASKFARLATRVPNPPMLTPKNRAVIDDVCGDNNIVVGKFHTKIC